MTEEGRMSVATGSLPASVISSRRSSWGRLFTKPQPDPPPEWDGQNPAKSLKDLRDYAEKQASTEIGWYAKNIRMTRRISRALRFWALVFTAIGGLVPILSSMKLFDLFREKPPWKAIDFGQVGYLMLAIAGGVFVLDRFFGFSAAWMRWVTTMMALEKLRETFRVEWIALTHRLHFQDNRATGDQLAVTSDADITGQMISACKTFILQMKEQTEKETEAWVSEFKSALTQFEKDLRAQMEAARPGGIDVRVEDGDRSDGGVELALDQMVVERVTGKSGSIGFVVAGLHKITISGKAKGKTYTSSQMVTVNPGGVVQAKLSLGIPATPPPSSPRPPTS